MSVEEEEENFRSPGGAECHGDAKGGCQLLNASPRSGKRFLARRHQRKMLRRIAAKYEENAIRMLRRVAA